jgi:hypothetical protein
MTFNPEDAPRYLEGIDYPASKEDLISAAETTAPPDELIEMNVVEELRAAPGAG